SQSPPRPLPALLADGFTHLSPQVPCIWKKRLKMSEEQVLKNIFRSVSLARGLGFEVEFSAEDATRSEPDFLIRA
ncbi:Pyruvate carboxyltransferase domain protein, partial [mine drainage metagenome]